jgi:transforming growth factor-beta-induced protein
MGRCVIACNRPCLTSKAILMRSFFLSFSRKPLLVFLLLGLLACEKEEELQPVLQILNEGDFLIFREIIRRSNNTAILSEPGRTLFIPNQRAWEKIGIKSVQKLDSLKPADLEYYANLHFLRENLNADSLAMPTENASELTRLGVPIYVSKNERGVSVNGFIPFQGPIKAINGTVYIMEDILFNNKVPLPTQASFDPDLSYFVAAVNRSGLSSVLSGAGPFTIFAPNNAAFIAAGYPTIQSINSTNPNVLANLLNYHVIQGRVFAPLIKNGDNATRIAGRSIKLTYTNINDISAQGTGNAQAAKVLKPNASCTNGVIHVISSVLRQ